LLFLSG